MDDKVSASDKEKFLTNATWAVCSTYHTVLTASPDTIIFGRDMLLYMSFIATVIN